MECTEGWKESIKRGFVDLTGNGDPCPLSPPAKRDYKILNSKCGSQSTNNNKKGTRDNISLKLSKPASRVQGCTP